ncbi:thiamine pyrophosphate-binding protein [Roseitranquillus sediminis]|uniref:thiamine pyrophosphate-binding protein n=1 Tax=Roseitranquillus sediminis TaxID=2809051 RepID=UPI001D0C4A66|nr:thiamine pyrophosphate-binding protein [Roseitranquillus sediminis]MBM9593172.1 thiamine pyrophosphate-binding protein [Roseitranquillus sediminis]
MASDEMAWGSDLMAQALRDLGTDYVFLNPGSSFRGLHDSLANFLGDEKPKMALCTHEMIAVAMAHGYAKATGNTGVAILHNLVGLMNGSMSIFNAFCDQTPVLIIGGSGPADPGQRRFIDWAHSANAQGDLVRPYVKWTDEPATLDGAMDSLLRAARIAQTAPKGPVYVSLDAGLQEQPLETSRTTDANLTRYAPPPPVHPDPAAVERVAARLLAAEAPLIVCGRLGIDRRATLPLVRLVEATGAAYLDDRCIACLPTRHPQNLNGDRKARSEADVILALDVHDLTLATTGYGVGRSHIMGAGPGSAGAHVIDVSLSDWFGNSWSRFGGPTPPRDDQIPADPLVTLEALADAAERLGGDTARIATRRDRLAERHEAVRKRAAETLEKRWSDSPISVERLTHEVFQAVRAEDWRLVVRNHRSWKDGYWAIPGCGHYLGGDGGGGVGYGPGAAVGAALGLKGTGVLPVAILGDGDFMMAPGAIWTAAHLGVPLLMVLMNNRSWGNDELHQREIAHQRGRDASRAHIGQRTHEPDADLATVARGFGAWAAGPVADPEALAPVLREAVERVKEGEVAVVEVVAQLE